MTTTHADRVRRGVESCTGAGLDVPGYATAVLELLRRAIPYDSVCMATTDPATGLLTSTHKVDLEDSRDDLFAHFEYEVDDVNLYRDIARRADPVGVLALDTDGHPDTSPRWREFLVPHFGYHHELRAAFRIDGQVWGALGLYREAPGSGFSPAEADFVAGLSETVGRGLRAAVVTSAAITRPGEEDGPAVLIVGSDGELGTATPAALRLLAELDGGNELPTPIHVLVASARAFREGRRPTAPRVRLRMPTGEWFVLSGAPLGPGGRRDGDVVVTIERARPPDIVPLVVAAHGLTDRETDVVRLVLAGVTTTEIGRQLHLSPYTIQDHLKSIFAKAGVRSRRELTAQVFFDQYAPRLGDPLGPSGWFAG
jgi:DNA-binding CsgD family transcriptional regulator